MATTSLKSDGEPPQLWFSLREGKRPLLEHLEELRRRLLRSFGWVALGTVVSFHFSEEILAFFLRPVGRVVFLTPAEPFGVHLKVALLAGVVLSSPLLAWEIWGFLMPALRPLERHLGALFIAVSAALFLLGIVFGWKILLPATMAFLLQFASDSLVPMMTVGGYTGFAGWILVACGLIFEMPLVVVGLTRAGLIRPQGLIRHWRVALVSILAASAMLTPTPDVVTQLMLSLPMGALYVVSVGLAILLRGRDGAVRAV